MLNRIPAVSASLQSGIDKREVFVTYYFYRLTLFRGCCKCDIFPVYPADRYPPSASHPCLRLTGIRRRLLILAFWAECLSVFIVGISEKCYNFFIFMIGAARLIARLHIVSLGICAGVMSGERTLLPTGHFTCRKLHRRALCPQGTLLAGRKKHRPKLNGNITTALLLRFGARHMMNLHPHAVLCRVLWRWYQSPSGFKSLRVF